MSQTWTTNSYQIDHDGATDLTAFESNFECLKSNFSGLSAPSSPVAGQRWYDITHKIQRAYINSAWIVLMPGDINQKIWSYCNSCPEGMVLVTMVDKVLAIKGGTGNYNVSGGNTGGSWSLSHTHGAGSFVANTYHRHSISSSAGGAFHTTTRTDYSYYTDYQGSATQAVTGASATGGTSTWRPAGSIGIMIKPDI